VFRAMAQDPDVQYLAHTVDPVDGQLTAVVQFKRPKTSKVFTSGNWTTLDCSAERVTNSTAQTVLGTRVWAYGSLSSERTPRVKKAANADEQQEEEETEHCE